MLRNTIRSTVSLLDYAAKVAGRKPDVVVGINVARSQHASRGGSGQKVGQRGKGESNRCRGSCCQMPPSENQTTSADEAQRDRARRRELVAHWPVLSPRGRRRVQSQRVQRHGTEQDRETETTSCCDNHRRSSLAASVRNPLVSTGSAMR